MSRQRTDEELQELELGRGAVGDHEHAPAGLGHAHHLAERARLVGHEHDPELRCRDVEAVAGEVERVTVHHASLRVGQPFLARASPEGLDHRRRPVGGKYLCSQSCRR